MILSTDPLPAYRDLAANGDLTRYTAFVNYEFDGFVETEEIDVDAQTPGHAREIAQAALARDYEPGGKIVHVEELQGVLIYSGVIL